jgi:lipase chaperone LimK
MQALSENSGTTRALRVVAFGTAALVSVLATIYFSQGDPPQNAAAPAMPPVAAFGPGLWTGSAAGGLHVSRADADGADIAHVVVPGELAATEDGKLIVNSSLLEVIDYFLLEQPDANRASALTSHLQNKLPASAFQEAVKLVGQYQAYMAAHDNILATQNFGVPGGPIQSPDLNRIANWCEQRDRLRRRMLGDQVTEGWYQNEDAQLKQVLDELQQARAGTSDAQDQAAPPETGPRPPIAARWTSVADEVQHNPYMQDVLARATASFSTLANQRRQWAVPYAAFADAARRVYQNTALDSFEKNLQMQELLNRFFHTEPERQFARHRWESRNGSLN